MSRLIILFSVILMTSNLFSQKMESEINQLRKEHSETLSNLDSKVLTPEEIKNFGGLDYFEFDTTFQIKARLTLLFHGARRSLCEPLRLR